MKTHTAITYNVNNISNLLWAHIEKTGIPKSRFANRIGITPRALENILQGESVPLLKTIIKIQKETGISFLHEREYHERK